MALNLVPPQDWPGPYFYANFMATTMTPHDVALHFARYTIPLLNQAPQGGSLNVPVEPVASVSIPLNLVRAVASALEQAARNWEANFDQPLPSQPTQQPPATEERPST